APIRLQLVVLGLAFVALGVVTDSVYAVLAGAIAERLRTNPGFHRWRRVIVSAVYVFLGIAAALLHPPGGG
ncbi:MAG TPA: LysE family translocator, partial [Candidatus Krumholzibacteria bacterium]|nr:LysE family translocator [Candidatus Krumholzibacteria bacterium]